MIRVLLRNLASLTAMRVLSAAFALALVAYIARMRGAEELGEFALLLSVFLLTQQLPLLGLHLLLERDSAAQPQRLARRLPSALALSLATAVVLAGVVGLAGSLAYSGRPALQAGFWLIGLALLPAALTNIADAVLFGQQRMHVLARIGAAENLGRAAAGLAAVALGYGVVAIMALFLVARGFAVLAYLRDAPVAQLFAGAPVRRSELAALLGQVPVFLGILVLGLLMTRVDMIVLAQVASMREVGLYAAPYKVYEVALMAPTMVVLVLYPALAGLFIRAPRELDSAVHVLVRGGLLLGIPAALAVAFAAPDIMRLLFGQGYAAASDVLQLLAACLLLVWIHQVLSGSLLAARRQRADLAASAVACAIYLPALTYLAGRLGAMGAAIATAIMWGVQVSLRLWMARRAAGAFGMLRAIAKLVLAGAAGTLVAFGLADSMGYGALALGLASYALLVVFARAVTRADLQGLQPLLGAGAR